jgi:hypothetical protein
MRTSIGMVVAIGLLSKLINYLLSTHTVPTMFFFVGLIGFKLSQKRFEKRPLIECMKSSYIPSKSAIVPPLTHRALTGYIR